MVDATAITRSWATPRPEMCHPRPGESIPYCRGHAISSARALSMLSVCASPSSAGVDHLDDLDYDSRRGPGPRRPLGEGVSRLVAAQQAQQAQQATNAACVCLLQLMARREAFASLWTLASHSGVLGNGSASCSPQSGHRAPACRLPGSHIAPGNAGCRVASSFCKQKAEVTT
ncbi:hypothetical protein BDV96DRAFT_245254 [Lophiotrema nucula]|uniref:Uncharacterized protein n=1 Tax=Lophiotrema nucula TaxID=690887 RepID=A0A6A5YQF9_9PLEO|nr:hypothetical protein BDV96DRAFT_245254 [Lophiotrema nucula]